MKNKKWLLLLIIAFPSFFWLILETSTINSRKLPYYGPKVVLGKGDTSFYVVADKFSTSDSGISNTLSQDEFPLYAISFIHERYRKDAYRLTGLWEYLNYKKEKLIHIPFVLVTAKENNVSPVYEDLKKLGTHPNVHFYQISAKELDDLVRKYFREKPFYIDYSFFVLVDAKRNIRGYYDGRYVSEIKRLIEEYQHLRLKEEKKLLIKENEIKTES